MSYLAIRTKGSLYTSKVIATGPLVYFPLNESSGTTAYNRGLLASANGRYAGVDLANLAGPKSPFLHPYFDGVNDYCDIDSAALDAAYNGQLGSLAVWYKMADMSVWTDGNYHRFVRLDRASAIHRITLMKDMANNTLIWDYVANSVIKRVSDLTHADTNWHFMAVTWSLAANQMKAYFDGAQIGSTQTGLGTWAAGSLDNAMLGALNTTPTNVHKGWLAHAALWTRVLSDSEILSLA
jgi:hypothetical protein